VHGARPLKKAWSTLHELGLMDGSHLTCVAGNMDCRVFGMFMIWMAKDENWEAMVQTLQGYYWTDYALRRQSDEFAIQAAATRAPHRKVDFPVSSGIDEGDPREEYESRRRTVEWAVRAAQERELRISALMVSGTNSGEICIGSRPRKPTDRVPDASWKQTKPDSTTSTPSTPAVRTKNFGLAAPLLLRPFLITCALLLSCSFFLSWSSHCSGTSVVCTRTLMSWFVAVVAASIVLTNGWRPARTFAPSASTLILRCNYLSQQGPDLVKQHPLYFSLR